jgi:hypothetical protein
MTAEAFQIELDAALDSMSESELLGALMEAGCVFNEPWLDSDLDTETWVSVDDGIAFSAAGDYDELALAA